MVACHDAGYIFLTTIILMVAVSAMMGTILYGILAVFDGDVPREDCRQWILVLAAILNPLGFAMMVIPVATTLMLALMIVIPFFVVFYKGPNATVQTVVAVHKIVQTLGRFVKNSFVLVHTELRTAAFIDTSIGVLGGYLVSHNSVGVLVGLILGLMFGTMSWHLVNNRSTSLATTKN